MSISIEINKDIYYGRDQVRGMVTLYSQTVESISSVAITLRGTSNVKLSKDIGTGPRPHRSRQILFSHTTTLHSGDLTLPAGSHVFRFEVSIPLQSDRNQGDDVLAPSKPFHGTKDRHLLPPTFSHVVNELEADFTCSTDYTLEAQISRPASMAKLLKDLHVEKNIFYISSRPLVPTELKMFRQTFIAKSLRLLPDKANSRLSVRERVRSTFKSSELPSATFHTVLWIPSCVTKGEIYPVRISVRYGDTTAPTHPTIRLKAAKIEAQPDVVVRTRSLVGDYRVGHISTQTVLDRKDLDIEIPAGLSDTTAADENDLDLSSIGMNTGALYVDFTTCNISVATKLEVELQIMCADKKFYVNGHVRLQVLPPIPDDNVASWI